MPHLNFIKKALGVGRGVSATASSQFSTDFACFNSPPASQISKVCAAQSVGWDRSPIRRKNCRRGKRKSSTTPLKPLFDIGVVVCLTLHYFTGEGRNTIPMIMMDALIVSSVIPLTTQLVGSSSRYLLEQSKLINSRMHSLFGNTTIINLQAALGLPEPPHNRAIPVQLCKVIPPPEIHFGAITKDKLLEMRPRKTTPPVQAPPVTQTSTHTRARPKTRRRRTARVQKQKHFLPKSKKQLGKLILPNSQATPQGNSATPNSRNSNIIQLEANRPAPPPSGAPGAAKAANEECKPQPFARSSLSGRGSRAARRRLYRQWRVALRGNIRIQSLGKTVFCKGTPQKAASFQRAGKNNAKLFRHLVLEQAAHRGPQREKTKKPLATPPLDYGVEVRVGAQNVQGMAELLKHQQCLDMMSKQSLEVLSLTETKSTSYYTYNSHSHLFILNGSPHDKYGGVAAMSRPGIPPLCEGCLPAFITHTTLGGSM